MATSPATVRMPRSPLPPNSVFQLAATGSAGAASTQEEKAPAAPATAPAPAPAPKPKATTPRLPREKLLDVASVAVRSGMPLPPAQHGKITSVYAELYARMKKGDMVELTPRQATSFRAWAKAKKRGLAVRTLGPGKHGCWRTE